MSIKFEVLGKIQRDNALHVEVDSGQSVESLLFDCGQGCIDDWGLGKLQSIDHLFFSHLHMDHITGFDTFFRANYNRETKENHIWGPPETAEIMHHRFQGFIWNLNVGMNAIWFVHEFDGKTLKTFKYKLGDSFKLSELVDERIVENGLILESNTFRISATVMDHNTPCLAFRLEEKPKVKLDMAEVNKLGLTSGTWMSALQKKRETPELSNTLAEVGMTLSELKSHIVREHPGQSIAYVTDIWLDDYWLPYLSEKLKGVETLVCESQYRHEDIELARKNYHTTSRLAATLAKQAEAKALILFHLSERYSLEELEMLLGEAKQVFPNAGVSSGHWGELYITNDD